METKRITVSVPTHIYNQAKKLVKDRELSSFVADAIQEKVFNQKYIHKENPIEAFRKLRGTLPKRNTKQILEAIRKGRT